MIFFLAHCFGFMGCNFTVLVYSYLPQQLNVQQQQVSIQKAQMSTLHASCPASNNPSIIYHHLFSPLSRGLEPIPAYIGREAGSKLQLWRT